MEWQPSLSFMTGHPTQSYLAKRGFKPCFDIIDNVASKPVQVYLKANDIKIQLVEPHNHMVNAAERVIQTFKNHLIAGFCTIDRDCRAVIWSKFTPQAQDSLNMLRTLRVHPKGSTYHILEGIHDLLPNWHSSHHLQPTRNQRFWGTRALDEYMSLEECASLTSHFPPTTLWPTSRITYGWNKTCSRKHRQGNRETPQEAQCLPTPTHWSLGTFVKYLQRGHLGYQMWDTYPEAELGTPRLDEDNEFDDDLTWHGWGSSLSPHQSGGRGGASVDSP